MSAKKLIYLSIGFMVILSGCASTRMRPDNNPEENPMLDKMPPTPGRENEQMFFPRIRSFDYVLNYEAFRDLRS